MMDGFSHQQQFAPGGQHGVMQPRYIFPAGIAQGSGGLPPVYGGPWHPHQQIGPWQPSQSAGGYQYGPYGAPAFGQQPQWAPVANVISPYGAATLQADTTQYWPGQSGWQQGTADTYGHHGAPAFGGAPAGYIQPQQIAPAPAAVGSAGKRPPQNATTTHGTAPTSPSSVPPPPPGYRGEGMSRTSTGWA